MKKQWILAAVAVAAMSVSTFGQAAAAGPMGPPKPADAPAAPPGDVKPAPAPAAGVGGTDIVSPDAVKRVDDQDLINSLTQTPPTADDQKVPEQVKDMLDRMTESQQLLAKKDPGDVTQETQRRILTDLDVLIEYAKKQQKGGGGSGKPDPSQQPKDQSKQFTSGQNPSQGGNTAAPDDFLPGNNQQAAENLPDIKSGPAEWGQLPARDRELVSHAANEQPLASYRTMIQNYYKALAELDKNRNH